MGKFLFVSCEPQGIRLSKAFGEGVAWLKDIDFSNGTIEFDVRGEDVEQHSFVGLAFHGQNDSTFDAIYLRPFRFNSQDTILEKRMIQYISLPSYTWRKLRAELCRRYFRWRFCKHCRQSRLSSVMRFFSRKDARTQRRNTDKVHDSRVTDTGDGFYLLFSE
jgi:hypothetical protein